MIKNKIVRVYDCRKNPLSDLNDAFDEGWILKLVTPRDGHVDYILAREETPKMSKIRSTYVDYKSVEKKHLHEIIFNSRQDAEKVLDTLNGIIHDCGYVSVADFYDLVGMPCNFPDSQYGWTTSEGWIIKPYRLGYRIDPSFPKLLYKNDRR